MFSRKIQMFARQTHQLLHQTIKQTNRASSVNKIICNSFAISANAGPNESLSQKFDKTDLEKHLPTLINELTNLKPELEHVANWYKDVLDYNVVSGKRIRALTFMNAYQIMEEQSGSKGCDRDSINSLAWAIELLQVFFLIADDIMDHSITRRGSLCWHKKEEVGLIAINDSFFLEQCVYQILRKFKSHKCYIDIVDLFLETTQKTVYGQSLDILVSPIGKKVDITKFNIDRYLTIAKYKTAFYSSSLPIRLALYVHEINDERLHRNVEDIMSKVGTLLQIQDDYLDAFADPKIIGKIGTDIQDGKCCWPIVMCMKLASNDQKEILFQNYGINDEECVHKVKEIYKELKIENLYKQHEEQLYNELINAIDQICNETQLSQSIFRYQVDRLYKRTY